MGRTIVWVAGFIALILLALFCASHHQEAIESDLAQRAQDQLGSVFSAVTVSAEGRDLFVEGAVASEERRAQALAVAKVYGARVAHDRLQVLDSAVDSGAEAGNSGMPSLSASSQSNADPSWQLSADYDSEERLQWQGKVSQGARDRLLAESELWLGVDGYGSAVETDDAAPWAPSSDAERAVHAALPFLKNISQSSLRATADRLIFRGSPESTRQAESARAGLDAALPAGMELETQWQRQWSPQDLMLEVNGRSDGWLLTGLVPSGRRDHWRSTAIAAGFQPLEEHLLEADVEAPADFGRGFEAALPELTGLNNPRLVETPGHLRIDGLSENQETQDRLRETLAQTLGSGVNLQVGVASRLSQDQCQADLVALLVSEKIRFASGSARLSDQSDRLLQRLAETLRRCPSSLVSVDGHTDSDGGDDFNQALSKRRADAVARRLVNLGVAASRLTSQGFGEAQPLVSNDTAAGKAQNRRIEFRLREGR